MFCPFSVSMHAFVSPPLPEPKQPVEHRPAQLLDIEPDKLTQEEEDRIRALEALIAEEEGRTEKATEYQGDPEGEGER